MTRPRIGASRPRRWRLKTRPSPGMRCLFGCHVENVGQERQTRRLGETTQFPRHSFDILDALVRWIARCGRVVRHDRFRASFWKTFRNGRFRHLRMRTATIVSHPKIARMENLPFQGELLPKPPKGRQTARPSVLATDEKRATGHTLLTASLARPLLNPEVALKEGGAFFLKLSGAPE